MGNDHGALSRAHHKLEIFSDLFVIFVVSLCFVYTCATLWGSNKRNIPKDWVDVIRDERGSSIPLFSSSSSSRSHAYKRVKDDDDESTHNMAGSEGKDSDATEGSSFREPFQQDVLGNIELGLPRVHSQHQKRVIAALPEKETKPYKDRDNGKGPGRTSYGPRGWTGQNNAHVVGAGLSGMCFFLVCVLCFWFALLLLLLLRWLLDYFIF